MSDRLPAIEPDTRELLAAVRILVGQVGGDILRLSMQPTDVDKGLYALAVLEELYPARLQPLVAAHDELAAALRH